MRGPFDEWFILLRWLTAAGYLALTLTAGPLLGLTVVREPLFIVAMFVVASNAGLSFLRWNRDVMNGALLGVVCFLDILCLTAFLAFSGGPHNPLSIFYLVQIMLGAAVLGPRWSWGLTVGSVLGYLSLFLWYRPVAELSHHMHGDGPNLHLTGMLVAFCIMATLTGLIQARVTGVLRVRERELSRSREEALRAAQLTALATLAAEAAHQLSTPLGTISLAAEELDQLVRQPGITGEQIAPDLSLIRAEVRRCSAILERLAADGGSARGELPGAFRYDAFVTCVCEHLSAADRSAVSFVEPANQDELRDLRVPLQRVSQAVAALVANGVDASHPGDSVKVEVDGSKDRLCVRVVDHGTGIPQSVRDRVGEPFFTTKAPGEGMGLGVFLASSTAARLGGQVTFRHRDGGGTTAQFEIPGAVAS
jgi:two-component system sensor histidine kinase RegB